MGFFRTIRNSIYSPSFYASLPGREADSGILYFFLLILLLSLIQLVFIIPAVWGVNKEAPGFVSKMVAYYPKELEVKIQNGEASTNVQEPYFIKVPGNEENREFENLIVIDTKTPYSSKQFADYDTAAWLTKDTLFIKQNFQTKTIDLNEVGNYTINEAFINKIVHKLEPYYPAIGVILVIFGFLGILILYIFKLVYLLVLAVGIWLIGKMLNRKFTYGQSYKIGFYAMTLSLIVDLIVTTTSKWTHFSGFPFMFTLISLTIVAINYTEANKLKDPSS